MTTNQELMNETKKWLARAREKRKKIKLMDKAKENMIKNIDAYISDSEHFLEKEDLIRAFEAVVWAWSWIEIMEELELIK